MIAKTGKSASGVNLKSFANGVYIITQPIRTAPSVLKTKALLGELCENGFNLVLITYMTNVCVAIDSINQPV